MPFYSQVAQLDVVRQNRLQLAVLSMQETDVMSEFLSQHGVSIPTIVPLEDTAVPPMPTPTLILLNKTGLVVNVWQGKLDATDQDNVVKALTAVADRPGDR